MVQRAILKTIGPHVKLIGLNNPALVELVKKCPTGAEMLIVRILHILTEDLLADSAIESKRSMPGNLISEVMELYDRRGRTDVRWLIPVIAFMKYEEIMSILPEIICLQDNHFRDAVYTGVLLGFCVFGRFWLNKVVFRSKMSF